DVTGAIATVAETAAGDDPANGNPATSAILPADVVHFTAFTAEAANLTQASLAKVSTPVLTIIPLQTYSGQVVDGADRAVAGAVVKVVGAEALTTSGATGAFALSLPMPFGAHPQLSVSAAGYVSQVVNGGDYQGAAAAKPVVLAAAVRTLSGAVSGLAGGTHVSVYAQCGTERAGPLVTAGAFALAVANQAANCSRVWASAEGYANAVADNGGTGYDGDATGITLVMTPLAPAAGKVDLTAPQLANGGTFVFGVGRARVALGPDGLALDGAEVTQAELLARELGALTEVRLSITGPGGTLLPTNGAGSVVRRLRLAIPFDAARVPLGALESGTWVVYAADSQAAYEAGERTPLAPDALVSVAYVPSGLVTFDVTHLSVFGVESAALPLAYYTWAVPSEAAMDLMGTIKVAGVVPPPNTELGVFDPRGGLCGAAAVDSLGNYRLQVSGEGLATGETLVLKVYVPGRGQVAGGLALTLSADPALPVFEPAAGHARSVDVLFVPHQADYNPTDLKVGLSELLRVIQLYNTGSYGCDPQSEDGYAPGTGVQAGTPHTADYNAQDWKIGLSELLRVIQFYNSGGYRVCAEGEDGFCAGL
ncbi:MAG: hypothetical protein ACYDA8_05660, partial [Deferrisomatales bacterium]